MAIACRTIGLDPIIGVGLHQDVSGRQSLVWDVMEALRPTLDQLTIDVMASRVWERRDFHELPSGEVRLRPDWPVVRPESTARGRALVAELTRRLNDRLRQSLLLAHVVEGVAKTVAKHGVEPPESRKCTAVHVPTVLSQATLSRARRKEHGLTDERVQERDAARL